MKTLIIAALAASFIHSSAFAHAKKEVTTPADGAEVASVEEVVLSFDKPMRITKVSMTDGEDAIDLSSEHGMKPTTRYVATPDAALQAGEYSVEWHGMSADGHPMNGNFGFTVAP